MFKRALALWLFSLLLLVGLHYGEMYSPKDVYGDMPGGMSITHTLVKNLFRLVTASLLFSLLRKVLLPNLAIDEIILATGEWDGEFANVRAAALLAWAAIYVTVLYSFLMA